MIGRRHALLALGLFGCGGQDPGAALDRAIGVAHLALGDLIASAGDESDAPVMPEAGTRVMFRPERSLFQITFDGLGARNYPYAYGQHLSTGHIAPPY